MKRSLVDDDSSEENDNRDQILASHLMSNTMLPETNRSRLSYVIYE